MSVFVNVWSLSTGFQKIETNNYSTDNRGIAEENRAVQAIRLLNNHTYCLGDLVFHALAQNSLEYKRVSKFFRLKAWG